MKNKLHPAVYRRLLSVAHDTHRNVWEVIQDALVRTMGLEGVPLNDGETWGKQEQEGK